jgi:hypothetical protein
MGAAAFLFCQRWDPKALQRVAGIGLVASLIALVAVLMPGIGVNVNGASRPSSPSSPSSSGLRQRLRAIRGPSARCAASCRTCW